jgi:hypothetical protein
MSIVDYVAKNAMILVPRFGRRQLHTKVENHVRDSDL